MREVAGYAPRERSDQEVMFLELAEGSFYLWSHMKQEHLPISGEFLFLRMVRWCYDNGFVFLPEASAHHVTTVVTVANKYPGLVIDQLFHMLVVMFAGRSEYQRS